MAELATKEMNGVDCVLCPTCSKLYPTGGEHEVPNTCKRCGGPMDATKALKYGEGLARGEHNPRLAGLGDRQRAMRQPSADTMVPGAPEDK